MKKIYGILTILAFAFLLVACNNEPVGPGDDGNNPPTGNTASISGATNVTIIAGDNFDPKAGVTATDTETGDITASIVITGSVLTNVPGNYTLTYKVTGSDGKTVTVTRVVTVNPKEQTEPPTEIVIMHGAPYEVDPFHENFTGKEQLARQQKQREVEERLNVKVVYKAYPASAAWGDSRVTAIVNASVAGAPLADIYWTTSDWTQRLVNGSAIVPVDKYLGTHGSKITPEAQEIGSYNDQVYAFMVNKPTVEVGLFYNAGLVEELGIENPTELFLEGKWNWSKFDQWSTAAKAALTAKGDDYYVLGGVLANYAENMVPLNGGALINAKSGRVAFHQTPALQTYDFIGSLWNKGLYEPSGAYDAGSPLWQAGKVIMHPGSFWFVGSPDRWANLNFNLSFVPYPVSDTYTGEYVSPVSGVAVYNIASGMSEAKEELVFQVWNEIQLWKTDQQFKNEFETTLMQRFNDEASIEAFLEIYDKAQRDLIGAIGIGRYAANGWTANINAAIKNGETRTKMDEIYPVYAEALEKYLNGE